MNSLLLSHKTILGLCSESRKNKPSILFPINLSPVWRQLLHLSKASLLQALPLFFQLLIVIYYGPCLLDIIPYLHTFWLLLSQICSNKRLTQEDMGKCPWHWHLLFMQHRHTVPYYGLIVHLGWKASNLFYLSQIRCLHPIQWLLSTCMQEL